MVYNGAEMKASVIQENLSEAVLKVVKSISSRPQLPVLSNILIDARKDGLYFSGTDLEMAIKVKIGAKIDEPGKTTVPAKIFSEFVSSLPAGNVELSLDKETLHVNSGSYKAKFQTISDSEFPEIVDFKAADGEGSVKVLMDDLEKVLGRVNFAAAKDSMRPVLTGVFFEFKGKGLNLVSTDGFRLALDKLKLSSDVKSENFIVPSRVMAEVVKMGGEEISFKFLKDSNQVVFVSGDSLVLSQIIEGTYPDYRRIIPDESETEVIFDREELLSATRASLIFARENSNVVRWELEGNSVKIVSESPEMGENRVEVEAKIDGNGGEVAYNGKFILEFLQSVESQSVSYGISGALEPGLFRVGDSYIYVVMPINL